MNRVVVSFGIVLSSVSLVCATAAGSPSYMSDADVVERTISRDQLDVKAGSDLDLGALSGFLDSAMRSGAVLDAQQVVEVTHADTGVSVLGSAASSVEEIRIAQRGDELLGIGFIDKIKSSAGHSTSIGFAGPPWSRTFRLHRNGYKTVNVWGGERAETRWYKMKMPESQESKYFTGLMRRNSDFWTYARSGWARSCCRKVKDVTVRTRTWAGMSDKVHDILYQTPDFEKVDTCRNNGNLTISKGGVGVSMPLETCTFLYPIVYSVDSSRHEFGAMYDGGTGSSKQGEVAAMAILRTPQSVEPVFADYIWVEFGRDGDHGYHSKLKDKGW